MIKNEQTITGKVSSATMRGSVSIPQWVQGADGDDKVFVSTTEPTDEKARVWINPDANIADDEEIDTLKIREDESKPWKTIPAIIKTVGVSRSYNALEDKPILNGVTIEGDKTLDDYNMKSLTNAEILKIFS